MTSGTFAPTQSAVLNWTRTFSPTIVNEARLSYSRVGIDEGVPVDWSGLLGTDGNSKFGIAGGQPFAGLSAVTLGSSLSAIGSGGAIGSTVDNKIQFSENLTWQRGAHLLKIGGQAVRYRQNRYYAGNNGALGLFTYDGTVTGVAVRRFPAGSTYVQRAEVRSPANGGIATGATVFSSRMTGRRRER